MTKQELKDIIKECFVEEGIVAAPEVEVTYEGYEDDLMEFDNYNTICESLKMITEETGEVFDVDGNLITSTAVEITDAELPAVGGDPSKLSRGKLVAKVVNAIKAKYDQFDKLEPGKKAAIIAGVTAAAGAAVTAAIIAAKKKKAEEDKKNEQKK